MLHLRSCVLALSLGLAAAASAQQPERGLLSLRVPEGFSIEVAATPDLSSYPMFINFDDHGRLFVAESSGKDLSGKEMVEAPECSILMLEDVNDDGVFDRRTVYADKLSLPMGVLCLGDWVYTCSPPDLIRMRDTNSDGVADEREVLLTGWNVLNTASLHGPFIAPDGWIYLTHGRHGYSIETKEGAHLEGKAARIWRCKPDGTHLEAVCGGGFDNPIEIVFTGGLEMIGTMTYFTDPMNGQRDALMQWVEGGVYPKPHEVLEEFPRTGDLLPPLTKFARIAPSGLLRYGDSAFGDEYDGNLFSAQFNPHRVQRHVLTREGASFRSDDSDFLTSSDPDFHPTDIAQDADGSILISDTGGWYVDACPISRVAKPEVRGSIYRIRRVGASKPEDPWGREIDLDAASIEELMALFSDARPRVRDRAFGILLGRKDVEGPMYELFTSEAPDHVRLRAYWFLNLRPVSPKQMLKALSDPLPEIRMAACRYIGVDLLTSATAIDVAKLLADPEPRVRLAAAIALARMRLPQTGPTILEACAGVTDPFLQHGLVQALMATGDLALMVKGVDHADPYVRRAALIAADQRQFLDEETFTPFLGDTDPAVRRAALWIASRHPTWDRSVAGYLATALAEWTRESAEALTPLLDAFAANERVQKLVASTCDEAHPERTHFLLGVVERAPGEVPSAWVELLGKMLGASDADLQSRALSIIRSRGIAAHDAALREMADNASLPDDTRLAALDAIAPRVGPLDATTFDYLVTLSAEGHPAPTRQAAARILARAELSQEHGARVAAELLPAADALTFGSLLDCVGRHHDEATGVALVSALERAKFDINRLPPKKVEQLFAEYPESVRANAKPLTAQAEARAAERVAKLQGLLPKVGEGDVGRGRHIFFGEKAACSTCHAIGAEGGRLGPDLTTIGVIRSAHDLAEAILFPSASLVQGYESWRVETEEASYVGVITAQSPEGLTIKTAATEESHVPRDAITAMDEYPLSIMPEGLDAALSEGELLDLLAFLVSLNNEQWLLPERREVEQ